MKYTPYSQIYRNNLLNDVIPFWLKNSKDSEYGGFLTCLDREGKVFDTDKFAWLQFRQIWCFSMLYNNVEQKKEWLDFAIQGAEFMKKHGSDEEGNFYFSLTREGKPLIQPFSIFSDCFAVMAFAQLAKATNNETYVSIAKSTFLNILSRQHNPKGIYSKAFPGTRPLQSFTLPMILSNMVLDVEHLLEPELVESVISNSIHLIMDVFYQKDIGLLLEQVTPEGKFSDSFEGRLVNPGHGLEAMWFILDLAERSNDQALIKKVADISLNILEFGWDKEHGGLFYFLDIKGFPPQQLEWDQKLWWVHAEAIVCVLKAYYHTGDELFWAWFEKLHEYTWSHFPDEENGEWFGYLNRKGEVLLPLKGGKWKGCFHVPRALYQSAKVLDLISEKTNNLTSSAI